MDTGIIMLHENNIGFYSFNNHKLCILVLLYVIYNEVAFGISLMTTVCCSAVQPNASSRIARDSKKYTSKKKKAVLKIFCFTACTHCLPILINYRQHNNLFHREV